MNTAQQVSFDVTKAEAILIGKIVARAKSHTRQSFDGCSMNMDITACHANGCPLRLQEFLDADDFNFSHDFWGIVQHIDRKTGQMSNHFLPRFTAPQMLRIGHGVTLHGF